MTLQQAKETAQKGIKVTHRYFSPDEYMIMRGNIIQFEDGVQIFFKEWTDGKDWLLDGWDLYEENN